MVSAVMQDMDQQIEAPRDKLLNQLKEKIHQSRNEEGKVEDDTDNE